MSNNPKKSVRQAKKSVKHIQGGYTKSKVYDKPKKSVRQAKKVSDKPKNFQGRVSKIKSIRQSPREGYTKSKVSDKEKKNPRYGFT